MQELNDEDIQSEIFAITKRIERIIKNIDALSPKLSSLPGEQPTGPLPLPENPTDSGGA
jgi:hypothetical protein